MSRAEQHKRAHSDNSHPGVILVIGLVLVLFGGDALFQYADTGGYAQKRDWSLLAVARGPEAAVLGTSMLALGLATAFFAVRAWLLALKSRRDGSDDSAA